MSDETPDRHRKRQHLLAVLDALIPPVKTAELRPVSDELDHLLWLFAEDHRLTEQEEERLWQLATREPGTRVHFQRMLDSLEKHGREDLSTFPSSVLAKANSRSVPAAEIGANVLPNAPAAPVYRPLPSLGAALAEMCVRVAREFLAVSPGGLTNLQFAGGMARGEASERHTSVSQQIFKRTGIYEVVLDHTGEQHCQLTVRVTQASDVYSPSAVDLELRNAADTVLVSQSLASGVARFRDLTVGGYFLVFLGHGEELDRMSLVLAPDATE